MQKSIIMKLTKMCPCRDALEWATQQPGKQIAWNNCQRGDWMLWLLGHLAGKPENAKRKKLVLCACECASLALKYAGNNQNVCEKTINTAREWVGGKASIEEVRNAAAAAAAASAAASVSYAAYAARAASAAAKKDTLSKCSDIVRSYYPKAPAL